MDERQARPWRSVEELVEIGFQRSRVVMMNEAHAGELRCIRTRLIGQRILPAAYKMGARYLAMEALWPEIVEEANRTRKLGEAPDGGYLAQPEMRSFIQAALDLGWMLVDYEAYSPVEGVLSCLISFSCFCSSTAFVASCLRSCSGVSSISAACCGLRGMRPILSRT